MEIDRDIIYHYSNKEYDTIKTLYQQGREHENINTFGERYSHTASFLPTSISKDLILLKRKEGFSAWGDGPLYEHRISIIDNVNIFKDKEIKFTSTPYQTKYGRKRWKSGIQAIGIDYDRMQVDDEYWEEVKEKFLKHKEEYILARDIALKKYEVFSIEEYFKSKYVKEYIENFDYWIKYNIKYGSKSQYASYIPHIHTELTAPAIVNDIVRII